MSYPSVEMQLVYSMRHRKDYLGIFISFPKFLTLLLWVYNRWFWIERI